MLPIVQTSRRSSCVLNQLANPYALHTTTRQSADLHHTARQASDEGHQIRFLEFGSGRVSSGGSGGCLTENLAW